MSDASVSELASIFIPPSQRLIPMSDEDRTLEPHQTITDDLLFRYHRCERRAFLDTFGDAKRQNEPSDYLLKIRQDSIVHRRQTLKAFAAHQCPSYPKGDWTAGVKATLALMEQGTDCIYRPVIAGQGADGTRYRSKPDLLIKQALPSWLGDWSYIPVDIRLGKKPKQEYQLVAAFHAYILSALQGICPSESRLKLRTKQHSVNVDFQLSRLFEVLEACTETLSQAAPPEVFISRSRCDMCVWLPHCYEVAQSQQHLSLLPGVTLNRYRHLRSMGLTSVEALADMSPTSLALASGFEGSVAEKLVHQAQATLNGVAIARGHSLLSDDHSAHLSSDERHLIGQEQSSPTRPFPLRPQDLPSAEIELYFDIEAAPDKDLVYLHGVLVVNTHTQEETFIPLVADNPTDEGKAWLHFQHVVASYPEAPIYHFCPYEAQTVRRLAKLYGAQVDIDRLLKRFVDIHKRITESVTLPVESYALKHIARWVGFEWRNGDANGAQSICWYDSWMSTGDDYYINAILQYNEDDCRATYWVKRWLAEFAQPFWKIK